MTLSKFGVFYRCDTADTHTCASARAQGQIIANMQPSLFSLPPTSLSLKLPSLIRIFMHVQTTNVRQCLLS